MSIEGFVQQLKAMASVVDRGSGYHLLPSDQLAIESEFGEALMNAVAEWKPVTIVEIGTGHGYSTAWLLLGAMKAGQGTVYSFDSEIRLPVMWDQIGLNVGALKLFRCAFQNVNGELPREIDFVFHDAQHRMELIVPDLEKVLPRMAEKSQIWVHDASAEVSRELKPFLEAQGYSYRAIPESCGMGIAEKKGKGE